MSKFFKSLFIRGREKGIHHPFRLPPEILEVIALSLSLPDLYRVVRVCRACREVVEPLMYHHLVLAKYPQRALRCSATLLSRHDLARAVVSFRAETAHPWNRVQLAHPLESVQITALREATSLKYLDLGCIPILALDILNHCTFQLRHLAWETVDCHPILHTFLERQSTIESLALTSLLSFPGLQLVHVPNLRSFCGRASLAAQIIPGRPVESVVIKGDPIYPELLDAIQKMGLSSVPVREFELYSTGLNLGTSREWSTPRGFLLELTTALPHLNRLEVMLRNEGEKDLVDTLTETIHNFINHLKDLRGDSTVPEMAQLMPESRRGGVPIGPTMGTIRGSVGEIMVKATLGHNHSRETMGKRSKASTGDFSASLALSAPGTRCNNFLISPSTWFRLVLVKMDDLFSHITGDNDPAMDKGLGASTKPKKKKRKAAVEVAPPLEVDSTSGETKSTLEVEESNSGEPVIKKQKMEAPESVEVDAVEMQAEREVAASNGLMGQETSEQGASLKLTHQVRHQVAVPPGYPYIPIKEHVPPEKPAREYPFTLDPFQQLSVYAIDRNESVLVSAHTSAGKTVVAEYAIAKCLRDKQRVIYTSPIKALSNQKYREMLAEFGDVGLMTGDVTINPTASCLVMTTEILRSMLYRGSEIMREVAWVIFDEIHYMRDAERGVVWEETIILLPHTVHYVFLSATIPNAMEFAHWISKIHEQPCHVVYTNFRPTPLQHYLFPAGGDGIYLVVNEKSEFREDNFQKAMGKLASMQGDDPADPLGGRNKRGKTKKGGGTKGTSDIYKIVKMIIAKQFNPVIVFAFSKRECEALALQMSKLECNSEEEQEMVQNVYTNAIASLSEEDRKLPQIEHLLPLLKRGIGIHHGGLLPILKEVIEILFQEGLIKVLFATETFSIGLNMPAKTVVFTDVEKFDGRGVRPLSSGEYIQMSGRAGRRGLDDRGVVIMMVNAKLDPATAKGMVKGEADRLDSAFHLGYNMVLNLMRVEGVSPEYMLERCFYQYQNGTKVPALEAQLTELEEKKAGLIVPEEESISEYYEIRNQLDELGKDFRTVITHPTYALPFLQPGRLVTVKHGDQDFGWGIVVNFTQRTAPKNNKSAIGAFEALPPQEKYVVDVLLYCAKGSTASGNTKPSAETTASGAFRPCPTGQEGEPLVCPVLLSTIASISHIRVHMPKELKTVPARESMWKVMVEVKRRFPKGIALLDPIANMNIKDVKFKELVEKIATLEKQLEAHSLQADPRLPTLYDAYAQKQELVAQIRVLKKTLGAAQDVMQMDELKSRKRVLRRLGFASADDVVEIKGRVACEISTGDELLLTEMIFNGVFNNLLPEQCAALLSCFVFTEKSEQATKLKEELAGPLRTLQEIARRIAKVAKESKMTIEEDEYVQSFKVELMDAVLQWCRGAKFVDICKMTDQFEGSLIRVFRRLQELIRQMTQAAHAIGNTELEAKFTKASEMLERQNSVIFCSSLYL